MHYSFVTVLGLGGSFTTPSCCRISRQRKWPHSGCKRYILSSAVDDSDDGTFGTQNETSLGMKIPGLSSEEAAHVNRAKTPEDFRKRLKETMERVKREGRERIRTFGGSSADDYMSSLARNKENVVRDRSNADLVERGLNKGELYLRGLTRDRGKRAKKNETIKDLGSRGEGVAEKQEAERVSEERNKHRQPLSTHEGDLKEVKEQITANVRKDPELSRESNGMTKKEKRLPRVEYMKIPNDEGADLPTEKTSELFDKGWSKEMQLEVMSQVAAVERKIEKINNELQYSSTKKETAAGGPLSDYDDDVVSPSHIREEHEKLDAAAGSTSPSSGSLQSVKASSREVQESYSTGDDKNDVSTLDKKIVSLENHLEKLAKEEEKASSMSGLEISEGGIPQSRRKEAEHRDRVGDAPVTSSEDNTEEFSRRLDILLRDVPETTMSREDRKEAFKRLFKEVRKNSERMAADQRDSSEGSEDRTRKGMANGDKERETEIKEMTEDASARDALVSMRLEANKFITDARIALAEFEDRVQQFYEKYAPGTINDQK